LRRRSGRGWILLAWSLAGGVATLPLASEPVHADPGSTQDSAPARTSFDAGRAAYERGAFAQALAEFDRAHAQSPQPDFLYHVGLAADSDGQAARALAAYASLLAAQPDSPHRAFVAERIAALGAATHGATSAPAVAAPAPAQDLGLEPPAYRGLIDEAMLEWSAKNYDEALALFLRAHALFPSARSHRGIAMTEFELRNYPACIAQIEAALRSNVRPLDIKLRLDAERLLARAQAFVGRLVVTTTPRASELRLDGQPLSDEDRARESIVVKLGEHTIEALVADFEPEKRVVRVRGGEFERLSILFTRRSDPHEGAPASRTWLRSPWLWSAVGVVVTGAVVGTALAMRGGDSITTAPSQGGSIGVELSGPRQGAP
jgi:tetratricopeptide (TPR) repeat protein